MFRVNFYSSAMSSLMLVIVCAMMFAFSVNPGGDSFTIFLNNRLIVEQFVHRDKAVKNLPLGEANGDDLLKINYSHCGKTGTARTITLETNHKAVKSWNFADGEGSPMAIRVKEVLAAQKVSGNKNFQLVYTSKEMPEGRALASIGSGSATASLK